MTVLLNSGGICCVAGLGISAVVVIVPEPVEAMGYKQADMTFVFTAGDNG